MYFKHLTKKRPKWFCPRPLVAPQKVSSSFSHLGKNVVWLFGNKSQIESAKGGCGFFKENTLPEINSSPLKWMDGRCDRFRPWVSARFAVSVREGKLGIFQYHLEPWYLKSDVILLLKDLTLPKTNSCLPLKIGIHTSHVSYLRYHPTKGILC